MRIRPWHASLAIALWAAAASSSAGQAEAPATGQAPAGKPYTERVEVHRLLLDVRATDGLGAPIEDLGASEFVVRIDGRRAPVESATWITGALRSEGFIAAADGATAPAKTPGVDGRLVVFLIQKDLEPSRIIGLMRLLIDARPFLSSFTPHDRVAVLSFDSHLQIWSDFTGDLDRVRGILQHDLLVGQPAATGASDGPSLVAGIDARAAQRASTMEQALVVLGQALERLPGAKSVVVLGHGFGRLGLSGVDLSHDYDEARRALRAARTSVFCLDITRADYHSLEVGLQQVAEDTGGFFERTHLFPARAITRLAGVLGGHYVLMVERPILRKGRHKVEVAVTRRGVVVLSRDFED